MRSFVIPLFVSLFCIACTGSSNDDRASGDTGVGGDSLSAPVDQVTLITSLGVIVLLVDVENAPITAANFFTYVENGFYDGSDGKGATIFHRVIDGFMIQGGGSKENMSPKTPLAPIENESKNGLSNLRGTIAMARTNDPNSATSQFFINTVDNTHLDASGSDFGYAVFGEVTTGLDVVDAISQTPTDTYDVPLTPVVIKHAMRP